MKYDSCFYFMLSRNNFLLENIYLFVSYFVDAFKLIMAIKSNNTIYCFKSIIEKHFKLHLPCKIRISIFLLIQRFSFIDTFLNGKYITWYDTLNSLKFSSYYSLILPSYGLHLLQFQFKWTLSTFTYKYCLVYQFRPRCF